MKFTKAVLAASVASMASAQCSIKSGQISTIGPLVQAWKLYNFQLTKNAALDVKIDAANQAKAAKDAVISGAHADVAAGHAAAEGTAQGEVSAERGAALAAQATKFDAAQGAIQASYDSAASAAQGRHDSRVAEFEAQIAVLNAKKADAESRHSANTGSTGEVSTQRAADANAKANSAKAEVSARQSRVAAKLQANSDSVAARYDARLANEVSRLNAKYAAVGNKIQGKKYDTDASLAHLDNAGNGGVAYAANCIVDVQDAIEMVKAGMMPNEIWYQVVIQGDSSARAAYVAPTEEPTDAPTTAEPTDAPTDAPTKSPTKNPTKNPTKSPTKSPTKAPTRNPTRNPTPNPTNYPTTFGGCFSYIEYAGANPDYYINYAGTMTSATTASACMLQCYLQGSNCKSFSWYNLGSFNGLRCKLMVYRAPAQGSSRYVRTSTKLLSHWDKKYC